MAGALDLRPAELPLFLELLAARDQADYGEADLTRNLAVDAWRTRSFAPEENSVVAWVGDRAVGAGFVVDEGSLVFVSPDAEGRGVGPQLLDWAETRGRARGQERNRQRIAAANHSGHALLAQAGYRRARSVHQMWLALARQRSTPAAPYQITLATLDVRRDAAALAEADARMFAGNADYTPMSVEDFCDEHLSSPELDPDLSLVARHGDAVAGFALCRRWRKDGGFVDLLAVDPSQRHRGLGAALLNGALDGFTRAGLSQGRLDVASDNPTAIRLYQRAGMVMRHETLVLEKPAAC